MDKQLKAYAILLNEKSVSLQSLVKGGYDMKFAFEFIKKLLALGFVKDGGDGNFLLCVPEHEIRKIMRAEKCEYKDFSDDELKRFADDIDIGAILVLAHISQSETGYGIIELCEVFKGDFTRHLEVLLSEGLISYDEGSYIGKISPENLLKLILMALEILSFELEMINNDRCDFDTPALKNKRIEEIKNLTAQLNRKEALIKDAIATGELVGDGDFEFDFGVEDDDDDIYYCEDDDSEEDENDGEGENDAESKDKVRTDMINFLKQLNVDDAEALYDQMFERFDSLDDDDIDDEDYDDIDDFDDDSDDE